MAIDILSRYEGKGGERRWQTASCWLYPGQSIAIVDNDDASIDNDSEYIAELLEDLTSIVDTHNLPDPYYCKYEATDDQTSKSNPFATVAWAKSWLDFFINQDKNCA